MNETDTTKRRDWQIMQQKVAKAFIQLYRDNQRQPTNAELAKEIGVSERTIIRHLKSLDFADYFIEQRSTFAPLMESVMIAIYNSAIKGKVPAQKLMLQIVFGWAEPTSYDPPQPSQPNTDSNEMAELDRNIELLVESRIRKRDRAKKYEKSG